VSLPPDLAVRTGAIADVLEDVLARWEDEATGSERARDALRGASHALQRFRDEGLSTARPLEPLEDAAACVERALLDVDASERALFEEARAEIVALRLAALDRIGPGAPAAHGPKVEVGTFRASVGAPSLRHGVEVPPIALLPPELQIDDEPDEEETQAAPNEWATGLALETPELAQLKELARDTMEDLGVLGGLRRPLPEEPWTAPVQFEQRLLAQLDALFALARASHPAQPKLELIRELYAYVTEWAIPDVARTFSLAMSLACIDGEAAARWLMGLLRSAHPRTHEAFADALLLGPSPAIPAAIAARLTSTEPSRALVTLLEVARRRGDIDPAAVAVLFAHPDAEVVEAVACAAVRLPKAMAVPLLTDTLDAKDARVSSAAAEALAVLGVVDGAEALRTTLQAHVARGGSQEAGPAVVRALRTLACLGRGEDAELVLNAARVVPDGLEWLGVYGSPAHLDVLLSAAEGAGTPDALRGLEHMVGGIWDIDPKRLARDPERTAEVAADRSRRREAAKGAPGRLRRGESHKGAATLVAALCDPEARASYRADWAFELTLATSGERVLVVEDWISRQRATLEAMRTATK
jgi:hypothetical protein